MATGTYFQTKMVTNEHLFMISVIILFSQDQFKISVTHRNLKVFSFECNLKTTIVTHLNEKINQEMIYIKKSAIKKLELPYFKECVNLKFSDFLNVLMAVKNVLEF